jgi:uncharacterized protein YggL (DUF469 family)
LNNDYIWLIYGFSGKLDQNGELRKGHILMCLREMAETNQRHQESIALILSDSRFAHLEVPQLFKETFVGMDDAQ